MTSIPIIATEPPLTKHADGSVRIGKSRVTLRTLITSYKQGATPEQIVEQFSTLILADVYLTIGYYLEHRREVDEYLDEQEHLADELRRESLEKFASTDLHQRLLDKHKERGE